MSGQPDPAQAWILANLSLLGLWVSGDLAELTIYTNRHGLVVAYPKSPPDKPPTYRQLQQRSRFRFAQNVWSSRSSSEKSAWELAVSKLGIDMTGQNAVISLSLRPDPDAFARLNAAVGGQLQPVPKAPW